MHDQARRYVGYRFFHLQLLFTVFVSTLIFCTTFAAAESPIRIGATVSYEGKYKEVSYMVRKGYELWVDEINRRGGLLGRRVELILYDDKSDIDLVRSLYEKLITEDKVDLVLSPYGSSLTMAASEVTEKHGYVMLACTASATNLWQRQFKYIFGIYATADRYFIGFEDLIARQGLHKLGIVYDNSTFNINAANGAMSWASMFGLNITFTATFGANNDTLSEVVKKLKNSDVDALIFCGYPPDGYEFINLMKKEKYRPKALGMTILPVLPEFYEEVGAFAENVFAPSQWESDERLPFPGTVSFIRRFTALNGKSPTYHACSAYSSCQILEKAIRQDQAIDHQRIRDFVASLDTVTIMGRFKVDHTGSQVGHNAILIQWQNKKKEIVYPAKMRTARPRFE